MRQNKLHKRLLLNTQNAQRFGEIAAFIRRNRGDFGLMALFADWAPFSIVQEAQIISAGRSHSWLGFCYQCTMPK